MRQQYPIQMKSLVRASQIMVILLSLALLAGCGAKQTASPTLALINREVSQSAAATLTAEVSTPTVPDTAPTAQPFASLPEETRLATFVTNPEFGAQAYLRVINLTNGGEQQAGDGRPLAWSPSGRFVLSTQENAADRYEVIDYAQGKSLMTLDLSALESVDLLNNFFWLPAGAYPNRDDWLVTPTPEGGLEAIAFPSGQRQTVLPAASLADGASLAAPSGGWLAWLTGCNDPDLGPQILSAAALNQNGGWDGAQHHWTLATRQAGQCFQLLEEAPGAPLLLLGASAAQNDPSAAQNDLSAAQGLDLYVFDIPSGSLHPLGVHSLATREAYAWNPILPGLLAVAAGSGPYIDSGQRLAYVNLNSGEVQYPLEDGVSMFEPSWSPDGRWLALSVLPERPVEGDDRVHAANLVGRAIYRFNPATQQMLPVTRPGEGQMDSWPHWSANGQQILFTRSTGEMIELRAHSLTGDQETVLASFANRFSPRCALGCAWDTFFQLYPLAAVPPLPAQSALLRQHADSFDPLISADGHWVAFTSSANDLVARSLPSCSDPDTQSEPCPQVYLRDLQRGQTVLVSANPDGTPGNSNSGSPALSTDGRWLVFTSNATNLTGPADAAPSAPSPGVFLYDRTTRQITRVSSGGQYPQISGDGRWVVYQTEQSEIVLYDRDGGQEQILSRPQDGMNVYAGEASLYPTISQDGKWVAFWSWRGDLTPGDNKMCGLHNCGDVFLYGRETASLERVPVGADFGMGVHDFPISLNADGQYMFYEDVVYDRLTRRRAPIKLPIQLSGTRSVGLLSDNARWMVFEDAAEIFMTPFPPVPKRIEQVSLTPYGEPAGGQEISAIDCKGTVSCEHLPEYSQSADGRFVAFWSTSSRLGQGDTAMCSHPGVVPHNCADIFVRDRQLRETLWVSEPVNSVRAETVELDKMQAHMLGFLKMETRIGAISPDPALNWRYDEEQQQVWLAADQRWRLEEHQSVLAYVPLDEPWRVQVYQDDTTRVYDPGSNTLTLSRGGTALPAAPLYAPPLYGSLEGLETMSALFNRLSTCYDPQFLGPDNPIAGRSTYAILLGRSRCRNQKPEPTGEEVIWIDQSTFVVLNWIVPLRSGSMRPYVYTVTAFQESQSMPDDTFTIPNITGATVIDRR